MTNVAVSGAIFLWPCDLCTGHQRLLRGYEVRKVKKVKFQKTSNDESSGVSMFIMDKELKLSLVPFMLPMMVNGSKVNISAPVYQRSMDRRALVLSFFCQPHIKPMYLRAALTDFNETWSQCSMTEPAYVIWSLTGSKVIQGHRDQKGNFTKLTTPPTDYVAWSCDLCIW